MKNHLCIFFLIFLTVCACSPKTPTSTQTAVISPKTYKDDLLNTINSSDKIIVTEHSNPFDIWDKESNQSLVPNDIVYKRKEIDKGEKEEFFEIINKLDGELQNGASMCIFEPHHTIEFYSKGKLLSKMEICFVCDHVNWSGSKFNPPWSLYRGLEDFLKKSGFEPKRDWASIAKNIKK